MGCTEIGTKLVDGWRTRDSVFEDIKGATVLGDMGNVCMESEVPINQTLGLSIM
jgi:hypothetical protein